MVKRSWTDDDMIRAVADSETVTQVSYYLGLATAGGSYKTVKRAITRLGLSTEHFRPSSSKIRPVRVPTRTLVELLVEHSAINNNVHFKSRLIKEGLLIEQCAIFNCPTRDMVGWCGKPIVLHLDHVNGINDDYRIDNLRLLCPNCHSQTDTYCGRNISKLGDVLQSGRENPLKKDTVLRSNRTVPTLCVICNKSIRFYMYWHQKCLTCIDCGKLCTVLRCKSCAAKVRNKPKIDWPAPDVVAKMIRDSNYLQVGKRLGVSDRAVRKYLTRNGYSVGKYPIELNATETPA